MAADILNRLWDMREIAEMVEASMPKAGRPATYKKRKRRNFKLTRYLRAAVEKSATVAAG